MILRKKALESTFLVSSLLIFLFFITHIGEARAVSTAPDLSFIMQQWEERRIAVAETMEASTVFVYAVDDKGAAGFGTGFAVAPGYILTNAHVIEGFSKLYVVSNKLQLQSATLVKAVNDDSSDFALLKYENIQDIPTLTFSTILRRTDRVSAWGYPNVVIQFDTRLNAMFEGSFEGVPPLVYSGGEVSSFVNDGNAVSIVHSASLARGNSGGPLINGNGDVVGVNTWVGSEVNEGTMVNAALPAEAAVAFLRSCGIEPQLTEESLLAENTSIASGESAVTAGDTIILPNLKKPHETYIPDVNTLSPAMKELWEKAKSGDAQAQGNLGSALYYGNGIEENPDMALYWLHQAVEQGHPFAQAMLGTVQITDASYKNVEHGLCRLQLAAYNDPYYASTLARFLFTGETFGVKRNAPLSFATAMIGARSGDAEAIALMAYFYYNGFFSDTQDIPKGVALAQEIAEASVGVGLAHVVLAWAHTKGETVPVDHVKAFEYAQKAADANEAEGMALLGYFYRDGLGVAPNPQEAFIWAEMAAERGSDLGRTLVGLMYLHGDGVAQNVPLGVAYLSVAAERNFSYAVVQLEEISPQLNKLQREKVYGYINLWHEQWGLEQD